MKYRFQTNKANYEDYSSGRVLYGLPGTPAFPLRIVAEIFQCCYDYRKSFNNLEQITLYAPCCGGYLLATLGFLFSEKLRMIVASDIDEDCLNIVRKISGLNLI